MDANDAIGGYANAKAMLEDLYVTEGLPVTKIAVRLEISHMQLYKWLKELGIPVRKQGGAQMPGINLWKIHRMDPRDTFTFPNATIAQWLNCSYSLVYKYKRGVTATWTSVLSAQRQDLNATRG